MDEQTGGGQQVGVYVNVRGGGFDLPGLCRESALIVAGTVSEIRPPQLHVYRRSDETGWLGRSGTRLYQYMDRSIVYRDTLFRVEETFRDALNLSSGDPIHLLQWGGTAWDERREVHLKYEVSPDPSEVTDGERALLFLGYSLQKRDAGLPPWYVLGGEENYHPDGNGSFVRRQIFTTHEGPHEIVHPLSREALIGLLEAHPYDPMLT